MLITKQPTANESPDPGQGGLAVTSPANTGHAETTSSISGVNTQTKTCLWTAFTAVGGQIKSITLKIDHASNGLLAGVDSANQFLLEYSLNGGGAWNIAVNRVNFTSSSSATFSVALSISQDLTQVRVRDKIVADGADVSSDASAIVTVSNIKIEVETVDAQVIVMM